MRLAGGNACPTKFYFWLVWGRRSCPHRLHGLPAFSAELQFLLEFRPATGTNKAAWRWLRCRNRRGNSNRPVQLDFQTVHFAQHAGELLLQVPLGALVIGIGQLADPVLKRQIPQILVDSDLALIQMLKWRFRLGNRQIPRANPERSEE